MPDFGLDDFMAIGNGFVFWRQVLPVSEPVQICQSSDLILDNTLIQVYFSPNGGWTDSIIKEIDNAKSEILVQASFSAIPIAKVLLEAYKRSVKVEAILDKSQGTPKYCCPTFLANSCPMARQTSYNWHQNYDYLLEIL